MPWETGTWVNPDSGFIASKISFNVKTGMKWVDSLTGAIIGDVTPEDIRFSFQYVYDHFGWNYPSVVGLYLNPNGTLKIEISGNIISFYEPYLGVWALHDIGSLPIIPKQVYESISDPNGFTPGDLGIAETLKGCGAFYFLDYMVGVSAELRANRNYFMPIVPNTDTDPTNIKIDWGIFKANLASGDWTVNVRDLIIVAGWLGWPPFPPPIVISPILADVNKDGIVNVLDLIIVATCLGASW
jgi:hypothetical protein